MDTWQPRCRAIIMYWLARAMDTNQRKISLELLLSDAVKSSLLKLTVLLWRTLGLLNVPSFLWLSDCTWKVYLFSSSWGNLSKRGTLFGADLLPSPLPPRASFLSPALVLEVRPVRVDVLMSKKHSGKVSVRCRKAPTSYICLSALVEKCRPPLPIFIGPLGRTQI